MKFQFSAHAIERMKARGISKDEVQKVILSFDAKQNQGIATTVFSKLLKKNNKLYLIVFFLMKQSNRQL